MAVLSSINLALYAQTDVGMVRSGNEDNFLILDLSTGKSWTASEEEPHELLTYTQGYYGSLLAVSDGMGGALAGEVASRLAVETVRDRMLYLQAHGIYNKLPFHERLRLSIEEANLLINGESQTNPAHKGLGATFTGVATQGNQVYFAQVGDSRAHLMRRGKIVRTTKDQSLVQQLIDAGQITEEEAETHSYRNVILQALGAHHNVNVEVSCLPLCQLDTLVICSDGLSGKISQDEIARLVEQASDFKSACQTLIDLANERGGEDNITVVIAQFSGTGLPQPSDEEIEPQNLPRSPDTPTEINWGLDAKAEELNEPQADLVDSSPSSGDGSSSDGHSKTTDPFPTPPTESTPFTAKLPRNPSDAARTNDLSDRVEPITAVFGPGDFEDDPQVVAAQERAQVTSPLEPRQTKPLASSSTQPVTTASTSSPERMNYSGVETKQSFGKPMKKSSKSSLYILTGLLMLGVAGLVIGVTSIYKQKAATLNSQQLAQMKIQRENQNQKDGKIERLRGKIIEINKKLEATNKPALKEKHDTWKESLNKLSQRLDEVGKMPPDQLQQISLVCDEIGNELKKIEDEVNNLQGLSPSPLLNRQPVKV